MESCQSKPQPQTVKPSQQTIDDLVLQSGVVCIMAYMPQFTQTNIFQTNGLSNIPIKSFQTGKYYPLFDGVLFSYEWQLNVQSYSMQVNGTKSEVALLRADEGLKIIQCSLFENGNIHVIFVNNKAQKQVQTALRSQIDGQVIFLQTDLKSGYDHAHTYVVPAQINGSWAIVDRQLQR